MSTNRISRDEIEKTHQSLALLTEQETRKLVKRFQKKQEPLLVYLAAVSEREAFNEEEQDIFFTMILMIWQALLKHYPGMKRVSMKRLEEADDHAFASLEQLADSSDADLLRHVDVQLGSHPEKELLGYVVEMTMESNPDSAVREEMRGMIFLSLSFVLDQLLAACGAADN
ncbi:MAG TPA: hypothetical protein VI958_05525 [Acidobacteriota bacterium]